MPKITFMGAGSSVFAKNVLGDCMTSPIMENSEIALYDIDADRMDDSKRMLDAINRNLGNKATIKTYLGVKTARTPCAAPITWSTPFRWVSTAPAR